MHRSRTNVVLDLGAHLSRLSVSQASDEPGADKMTSQNHPKNKTRFKSLNPIAAHEAVESIWDEGPDGLWIGFLPGWWTGPHNQTSCAHEWNVRDLITAFRGEYKPQRVPTESSLPVDWQGCDEP